MTRETKIGLLVGLAFIIVIGILLSDHMSSTNEPPTANLVNAGNNVREGVTTPAEPQQAPLTGSTDAPTDAPRQRVPTRADLAPKPPTVAQKTPALPQAPVGPQPEAFPFEVEVPAGPVARGQQGQVPADLQKAHPGEFVPVNPKAGTAGPLVANADRPAIPPKMYTAEAGDSVSRIAARQLGGNTKANRELIIKANPTLQGEGNVVQVGKTYVIPVVAGGKPAAVAAAPKPAAATASPAGSGDAAHGFVWYTVKENDNLWKIAAEQMGSGNAWATLKDFNKDILKGGENVRPNMRIRLPGKTVASSGTD